MSEHSALLRLAREAVNGWACYAKRDVEHREIARIHSALDDIDRHDAACETELTSHGYTPCRCAVRADICYRRKNPCICAPAPAPEGSETATTPSEPQRTEQLEALSMLNTVEAIVIGHYRHVERSPGVGAAAQAYALAVLDDVLSDLAALRRVGGGQ